MFSSPHRHVCRQFPISFHRHSLPISCEYTLDDFRDLFLYISTSSTLIDISCSFFLKRHCFLLITNGGSMCVDWRSLWIYLKIHVMLERKHEEIQISPRISSTSPDGGFSHMRHTLSTWCNLRRTISCFSFIENGPHGSVIETQQQHMQFMKINRKLLIGQQLTLPRNLFHRNRFFFCFFLWLKRHKNLQFTRLLRFFTTCRAPWFRNDFSYSKQLKKKLTK